MNRVDRLLALILHLQSKRVTTAEEIAGHFELSVRTIYRDLAALGEAGVPIVAEAGVGYSLLKGFHLPPVSFTPEEAHALVTGAVLVQRFADAPLRAQMDSALMKIRAILPANLRDQVARLERGLAMSARSGPTAGEANLCVLQRAVAQSRVLRFNYRNPDRVDARERTVEPLGLVHYLERWHLIAWCRWRNAYRDFRTDRMENPVALKETFEPRDGFSLEKFIRDARPQATLKARVKFSKRSADRARREWSMGILGDRTVADGAILTLGTGDWDWLAGWLVSFGCSVEVLGPRELRNAVIAAADGAAAHHRGTPRDQAS